MNKTLSAKELKLQSFTYRLDTGTVFGRTYTILPYCTWKARALFLSSSTPRLRAVLDNFFLQTPNSNTNWQTSCPNVCHTIMEQILPCLGRCKIINQFWDCPAVPAIRTVDGVGYPGTVMTNDYVGCMTHTAPSDSCFLAPDIIYKYSYLLPCPAEYSIRYSPRQSNRE